MADKRDEGHDSSMSSKKSGGSDGGRSAGEGNHDDRIQEEPEERLRFVLPRDDTGKGIDYEIMNKGSWKTLQEYCEVSSRWCGLECNSQRDVEVRQRKPSCLMHVVYLCDVLCQHLIER